MKNNIFVKCECSTHAIEIEYIPEEREYSLAFWKYGVYGMKMSWQERIRWCYNIMKTGLPWIDSIILSPGKFKEIVDFYEKTR